DFGSCDFEAACCHDLTTSIGNNESIEGLGDSFGGKSSVAQELQHRVEVIGRGGTEPGRMPGAVRGVLAQHSPVMQVVPMQQSSPIVVLHSSSMVDM